MNNWILDPNFWVLVAFLILVASVFAPLKRQAFAFFKQRQEAIQQQLCEAEAILVEASKLEKQALAHMDAVEAQVQEILVLAEQEAVHLKQRLAEEKVHIETTHKQFLQDYQSALRVKFKQEISEALMQEAKKEAKDLFQKHPAPLDFSKLKDALKQA